MEIGTNPRRTHIFNALPDTPEFADPNGAVVDATAGYFRQFTPGVEGSEYRDVPRPGWESWNPAVHPEPPVRPIGSPMSQPGGGDGYVVPEPGPLEINVYPTGPGKGGLGGVSGTPYADGTAPGGRTLLDDFAAAPSRNDDGQAGTSGFGTYVDHNRAIMEGISRDINAGIDLVRRGAQDSFDRSQANLEGDLARATADAARYAATNRPPDAPWQQSPWTMPPMTFAPHVIT